MQLCACVYRYFVLAVRMSGSSSDQAVASISAASIALWLHQNGFESIVPILEKEAAVRAVAQLMAFRAEATLPSAGKRHQCGGGGACTSEKACWN